LTSISFQKYATSGFGRVAQTLVVLVVNLNTIGGECPFVCVQKILIFASLGLFLNLLHTLSFELLLRGVQVTLRTRVN